MSSWNGKQSSVVLATVLIVIAGGLEGCRQTEVGDGGSENGPKPVAEISVTSEIRECPHTWRWKPEGRIESQVAAVTRGAHHVPEYNDCQKFLVEESGQLVYSQGQYAIFAVQDADLASKAKSLATDGFGVAAAVIYAEEAYAPLGIEKNFNCLVLHQFGGQWNAAMHPPRDLLADCSGEFSVRAGHSLTVKLPVSPLPSAQGHYSQLARWGFDGSLNAYYIVIACGEAVCYIGSDGFNARPTPTSPATPPSNMERRVHEVATWHDEQRLAAFPAGASSVQPTDVWGTVIPDTNLGNLNDPADFADWVKVAEVELSANHHDYTAKGFQQTTAGNRNIVESCVLSLTADSRGDSTWTGCPNLPNGFMPGGKCDVYDDASTGLRWRSKHTAVDGTSEYFCVKRYPLTQPDLRVPAAARWRWRADDELLWYRCMQGCCDEQT